MTENLTLLSVPFSEEEKVTSSTMRELLVLYKYYVGKYIGHLRGKNIVHFCDNKGMASVMAKGSEYEHPVRGGVEVVDRGGDGHGGLGIQGSLAHGE